MMESRSRGVLDAPRARGMTSGRRSNALRPLPYAPFLTPPSLRPLPYTPFLAPHLRSSSPGLTGRPSIPEAPVMKSRGRGVLDAPHARGMTSGRRSNALSLPYAPFLAPHLRSSSPGLTGRPSIPEASVMKSRSRGVRDAPHARGMTSGRRSNALHPSIRPLPCTTPSVVIARLDRATQYVRPAWALTWR